MTGMNSFQWQWRPNLRLGGSLALSIQFVFLAGAILIGGMAAGGEAPVAKRPAEFREIPARGPVRFRPSEAETQVPEHFQLSPHEFEYQTRLLRAGEKFRLLRVTFPSPV